MPENNPTTETTGTDPVGAVDETVDAVEQTEETVDEPDYAAENTELRSVLQAFVGEETDIDEFLNENLTYRRDGTPVFRMPESKEASQPTSKTGAPKRPRTRTKPQQSTPAAQPSNRDQRLAMEKRFAEWQVSG